MLPQKGVALIKVSAELSAGDQSHQLDTGGYRFGHGYTDDIEMFISDSSPQTTLPICKINDQGVFTPLLAEDIYITTVDRCHTKYEMIFFPRSYRIENILHLSL